MMTWRERKERSKEGEKKNEARIRIGHDATPRRKRADNAKGSLDETSPGQIKLE